MTGIAAVKEIEGKSEANRMSFKDPKCDSCYPKKSEVGGDFHVWESHYDQGAVCCDLFHNRLRMTAAREEQIMRAFAPRIARLRSHRSMNLNKILSTLGKLA